jgi:hypothetical protein
MTNTELIAAYDANEILISVEIRKGNAHDQEWATQIVVMETLRELLNSGMSIEDYNHLSDEAWAALCQTAYTRAEQHPAAPVGQVSKGDVDQAHNLGGAYFEQTYEATMNAVSAEDTITFQYQPPA